MTTDILNSPGGSGGAGSVTTQPRPKGKQREPQAELPREPQVGDVVWYWGARPDGTNGLEAWPATLLHPDARGNEMWSVNVQRFGRLQGHRACAYSAKPAAGCWSYRD